GADGRRRRGRAGRAPPGRAGPARAGRDAGAGRLLRRRGRRRPPLAGRVAGARPAALRARGGGVSIRVLLADDQPLLSLGFRLVLQAQPDIEVVGEAGNGARAVAMTRALAPDVVLMDVRMPVMDGIEATRR